MKFSIDREPLLRPIQLLAGMVERRQTLQILSNLHVQAGEDGVLTLAATDLSMGLVAKVESADVTQAGETTIPAHKLAEIWRSVPENAAVEVEVDGQYVVLRSGRSRFSLATLSATDFPKSDDAPGDVELKLSSAELAGMIDRVGFAMAHQDVRFFLNGMLLEITSEHVRMVATDGHRLSQCTLERGVAGVEPKQAILPRQLVLNLRRLLNGEGDVQLSVSDKRVRAVFGMFNLTSNLIDGRFPDYKRVIPSSPPLVISGDRRSLIQALQRVRILTNDRVPGVKLQLAHDQMTILANNPEQEEATEVVSVGYAGEPMQLGFNVDYLLDVLRVLGTDEWRMSLVEAGSSALLEAEGDDSAVYVVMPMKI